MNVVNDLQTKKKKVNNKKAKDHNVEYKYLKK